MPFQIRRNDDMTHTTSTTKYPFGELAVSDSLVFDDERTYLRARSAMYAYLRRHPDVKLVCRKSGNKGKIQRVA